VPISFNIMHEEYLLIACGHLRDRSLQIKAVKGGGQRSIRRAQYLVQAENSLLQLDDLFERAGVERLPAQAHEHDVDCNPV